MPNFTEKAIKETFMALLDERPLNEITIKDIVETCGISRNSFYYHFSDLPELIEVIVKEEAESIIQKHPSISSMTECFNAVVEFASHRKRAIMHIYRSVNRDVFENHLMNLSEYFVRLYIHTALAQEAVPDESKDAIVDYYKCVCFGLVLNWLANGMPEEQVETVRKIFELQKTKAPEIARLLNRQD